jgi:hypothetical protein
MKLRLLWLALCAAMLAGCATIPQQSGISIGPDVTSGLNSDEVYYSQSGPYVGATQDTILYGFLSAGNGPQNDYAVAREYLTKSFATKWEPNQAVLIQEGSPEVYRLTDHSYRVQVQISAEIDADGRYQSLPAGTTRSFVVELEKAGSEWRISSAPNQTIVVRANFKVLFRAYSIYFFDPSLTYLVPDVRWFPSRASTGTRLMNALLKGPSDWLRPAVVEVIPIGTKLNINSVTVEDGVAQVDLSAAALKVSAARRSLMKADIAATLGQLSDVTSVEISIQRTPQTIDTFASGQPPTMGSFPVVMTSSGLYTLNTGGVQAVTGSESKVMELNPTDFAYSRSTAKLALVTQSGVYLGGLDPLGEKDRVVDARAKQLSPQFDPQGALWTLPATSGAPFVVTGQKRTVLGNPWNAGTPISFSISPEGARIAVIYLKDQIRTLEVYPIERNKSGEVVSLGAPFVIPQTPSTLLTVTWSDSVTLAVLTRRADAGFVPMFFTVGGEQTSETALSEARSMSVNDRGEAFVLQPNGNVVEAKGTSWATIAQAILALHIAIE